MTKLIWKKRRLCSKSWLGTGQNLLGNLCLGNRAGRPSTRGNRERKGQRTFSPKIRGAKTFRDRSKFTGYLGRVLEKIYLKKVFAPLSFSKKVFAPLIFFEKSLRLPLLRLPKVLKTTKMFLLYVSYAN